MSTTTPPTTPPAMAPTFVFLPLLFDPCELTPEGDVPELGYMKGNRKKL